MGVIVPAGDKPPALSAGRSSGEGYDPKRMTLLENGIPKQAHAAVPLIERQEMRQIAKLMAQRRQRVGIQPRHDFMIDMRNRLSGPGLKLTRRSACEARVPVLKQLR